MALFGRRHRASEPTPPVRESRFAAAAAAHGLEPVDTEMFDGHLYDAVHESSRVLYESTPRPMAGTTYTYPTVFHDAFRGSIDGRTVVVANGWTNVDPSLFESARDVKGTSICVVELPSILPIACVQPRGLHVLVRMLPKTPTGNPAFDERFSVTTMPGIGPAVVAPEMQQLIMARDDWVFRTVEYLLVCIGKGAFESGDGMRERIDEVLAIVAAIPQSVLPARVDHSQDDLVARISKLESVDDAIAMLQELTPADRERLAHSDTPLAPFADVTTPDEAMARFESLDAQHRMQVVTMFMRVDEDRRDD
jgi:hypothetical protein